MAEETPKILELEKELKKRSARFLLHQTQNHNISLQDGYIVNEIPFDSNKEYKNDGYFLKSGNGIKILKPCEIKVHASIDFSRTNGGNQASDYCFEIMRGNNDQLAEIVVNTNDNGIHYNGHLVMPFIQVNAEDIIYLKIMASRGGTLNTYGDANKIKTYLCLETID